MVTVLLAFVVAAGAPRAASAAPGPILPPGLTDTLSSWLGQFQATVAQHPPPKHSSPPVYGGHLLIAQADRGQALLDPSTLGWVNLTLDRFKELGMGGVTVVIGYPMLVPGFQDRERYLDFYKAVAKAVRDRGMVLTVEQTVLYTNSVFSPWQIDFSGLTLDRFVSEQREMAQTIIDALHPDYLTIMHEPDTYAKLSGLAQLDDPATAAGYVRAVLRGLKRHGTKIGAGSGTWSSPEFIRLFTRKTKIDYVSIHIYWTYPESVDNGYRMAEYARKRHKPVVIDEAWLYKSTGAGVEGTVSLEGWESVFRRDVFDVFQPYDAEFLADVAAFARSVDARYVAPFWTNQLFAYVQLTNITENLSYQYLLQVLEPIFTAIALQSDQFSATGTAYRNIISTGR